MRYCNMRARRKSIIIITHKLNEVLELSDRVAVLRKGKYIDTVETKGATVESLTEMMVGEKVTLDINRTEPENAKKRIEMRGVTCRNKRFKSIKRGFLYRIQRRNPRYCRHFRKRTERTFRVCGWFAADREW